jgi:hypothetical protein
MLLSWCEAWGASFLIIACVPAANPFYPLFADVGVDPRFLRKGVGDHEIFASSMSEPCPLRRVLRLEIPACIQEHNQPRTSGIGALCQWARLESTGLFVGFDRREVLWAFVNKWKLTRWLILHKPLAEGNVVFRYFYLLQTG